MRVLDEQYYDSAWLSWMIKIGEIFQPVVKHNDPALFGLTGEQAIKMRISSLRAEKHTLEAEYDEIKASYLKGQRPYGFIGMNSLQDQIAALNKSIYFNRQRLKPDNKYESYDIERIKQIPIPQITRVNANGFFQTNPFRTEKEPSNSLFYYKNNNKWHDFAMGKSGDVIDLWMALNNCTLKQAMKELSTL